MFSTAVKLGDLNDFIAPSQACVVNISGKPVQQTQDDQEVRWQRCLCALGRCRRVSVVAFCR